MFRVIVNDHIKKIIAFAFSGMSEVVCHAGDLHLLIDRYIYQYQQYIHGTFDEWCRFIATQCSERKFSWKGMLLSINRGLILP